MPRSYSLTGKKEFDRLFKKGKRRYSRFFTLVFAPSETLKFGIITQKKVIAKASRRNYSRRVVREILRQSVIPSIQQKFSIAIIVKADLKDAVNSNSFEFVQNDLVNAIRQLR